MKENDLHTFTDVLNTEVVEEHRDDPTFWVNTGRKEEDGLTLAELAVVHHNQEALATLAKFQIPLDLTNPISGLSALHRASEMGEPGLLATILDGHDVDVNVKSSKTKRSLTPLHLAAAGTSPGHLSCLQLLLAQPMVEVDVKDVSWSISPLYSAGKARNREGVVKLLEQGANPDLKVGQTGKTVRDFLTTWLPDLEVAKVQVKKVKTKKGEARDTMMQLAKTCVAGGLEYTQQCLKFRAAAQGLDVALEGQELLEQCCRAGLADFVQVLLRRGADPDSFPAVLEAAERGDLAMLRLLRKHGADFTVTRRESRETVLHCLLKSGAQEAEVSYMRCVDFLLNNQDEEFRVQIQSIINKRDINHQTALHYATEKWPVAVTRALLKMGANIGIKNQWGEIPISRYNCS